MNQQTEAILIELALLIAVSTVAMFTVMLQVRNELRLLRRELYRISGYLLRREEEQRQHERVAVTEHQRL